MFGEVVFGAPAIFKTKSVCLTVGANLTGEKRVQREQKFFVRQLEYRTELKLIRFAIRGFRISSLERNGDAVTLALNQGDLGFNLDFVCLKILLERLLQANAQLQKEPIGEAILQLELMALHEIIGILVTFGGLRHPPMIGPSVFKLGLAFLDGGFLDFKFG